MPFDFDAVSAPFRMQPGLRRLASGTPQLTPQRPGDRALQEKLQVLQRWPQDALVVAPGFDATPALRRLCQHAADEHPAAFRVEDADRFEAPLLGWRLDGGALSGHGPAAIGVCLDALPGPWRLAGLLSLAFAEDFAIIDASGHVPWIAVCLPSHWAPAHKVGHHFAQVHAPVADNQVLLAASGHLARLVTGDERWERFVWTITPTPTLQMHPDHMPAAAWPAPCLADADLDADADRLAGLAFFRTERQTFIPLPEQGQAVFTIQVESRSLAEALDTPQRAQSLHDALASMSAAVLAYRGLDAARDRLLQWLARRAAGRLA